MEIKKISEDIMNEALQQRASDIHFLPRKEKTDIYLRSEGRRFLHRSLPPAIYRKLLAYLKFSSEMDIGEMKFPQHGKTSHIFKGEHVDLRLSTLPLPNTESLAIRILSDRDKLPLHRLFLFPSQYQQILKWKNYHSGLILFTGPTGCGKSTSIYALMEKLIETGEVQAVTLEDPIEKTIPGLIQVPINERIGFTYDEGLKAALRHDPDLIMVGELRDEETAQFAIRAALSGHLVVSTLHAKNASGTIQRMLEMNVSPADLEQTIRAVASQRLLLSPPLKRRAAILEILEGPSLSSVFRGGSLPPGNTFPHIMKKAMAYGFIQV